MAHKIETMAYAGQVPWHGLGTEVGDCISSQEMMEAAGLDWTVSKRPLHYDGAKGKIVAPEKFALVRDSDDMLLTITGADYVPVQNHQAFDFFEKFVTNGDMTMETAGSLLDGKRVWALARIDNAGFTVGKNDRTESYLLFSQPHILGQSMKIMHTSVRVVCNNTLTVALNSQEAGFRMPHVTKFDEFAAKRAEDALGISDLINTKLSRQANHLASKKFTQTEMLEFMVRIFDKKAVAAANTNKKLEDMSRITRLAVEAVETQPGAELDVSKGTWWGAFNAATFTIDHIWGRESKKQEHIDRTWFGSHSALKNKAMEVALEYAA